MQGFVGKISPMIVHKLDANSSTTLARCGALIQKHLLGLDFSKTWNHGVANPVNCPDCLLFCNKPAYRKIPRWEGVGRKART